MPKSPPNPGVIPGLEPNVRREDAQPRETSEDMIYRRADLPGLENDPRLVRPEAQLAPGKQEKRVLIRLEPSQNIPQGGLFISHNSRTFLLRPGRKVRVPIPLLNVLDDAVEDRPVVESETLLIVRWEKQRRYPYTILRDDDQDERRNAA